MRKRGSSRDSGFTLVEVLAALVILMVGLLGLLQAVIVALEYDTRNVLREESVRLAEEHMNSFRRAAGHESDGDFHRGFHDFTTATLQVRGGRRDFTIRKEFEQVGANARRLWVKVGYQYRGEALQHQIYTVKSNR